MKTEVCHKDGPAIAKFEYTYQAELFACEISKVHRTNIYVVKHGEHKNIMSTWEAGKGLDTSNRRIRVTRS